VPLQTVAKSIGRNIVQAFSHGIEDCNNVTMQKNVTQNCRRAKRLAENAYVSGAYKASDAYWQNQANWFPARGTQNYYAQFLHTARMDSNGAIVASGGTNIFKLPNGLSSAIAESNQGAPMAMAYGYAYDETVLYLSDNAQPSASAVVPSKLDPIPAGWGDVDARVSVSPY
jgi:hypothetical protein